MPRLIIDGERVKRRYLVQMRDRNWYDKYYLQGRAFKALIQLAHANVVDEFRWNIAQGVEYGNISKGNASQIIHQLGEQCPEMAHRVWFDVPSRRYRLDIKPKDIKFNFSRLKEYPDVEVREMIEDIQRKTGDVHERRNG